MLAHDAELGRDVAIKIARAGYRGNAERFLARYSTLPPMLPWNIDIARVYVADALFHLDEFARATELIDVAIQNIEKPEHPAYDQPNFPKYVSGYASALRGAIDLRTGQLESARDWIARGKEHFPMMPEHQR